MQDGERADSFDVTEDDVLMAIVVSGSEMPPDQYEYCYPAVRKKLKPEPMRKVLGPEVDAPWQPPASEPGGTPASPPTVLEESELPVPDGPGSAVLIPPDETWARRTRRRVEPPPDDLAKETAEPGGETRPPHWLDYS